MSSTLQELAAERAAAREAIAQLRLVPVMFELGARPHPPADLYRAYLAQSHVFVGLYWERYGWVAPDMDVSGLEDEWRLASQHPKLVYLKHSERGREPRLEALIDRIRDDGSTSYRSFADPEELRELLVDDLAVMLSERFEEPLHVDPPPADPGRPVRVATHAVPHPPSPLIGRDVELSTLADLLRRDDVRLVTLCGSGGSGKTRLANELALRADGLLDRRVAWADLSGLRSPSLVLPTVAGSLGVRDPGAGTWTDAVAAVVDGERMLVVVDNFEHVMPAAPEVADLLAATEDLKVVVTSRQPLRLRWENELPLQPLALPDPDHQTTVDAVATSPAVELLVDRIRRVRPGFVLGDDNVAAVAEVARRLDGLPLALELAAARMRVLQPAELLPRLERRLDALATTSPDLPERHRTLRATVTWSHDHLGEDEQRVLRRLGCFAGGAGIDAIEAVCSGTDVHRDEVLDLLQGLVDRSLVVSSADASPGGSGGTRFWMLETIREFAVEQLVGAGEAEDTWDRHLRWHVRLAERSWTEFWTAGMSACLGELEAELDNLRTALDHAAGAGDPELGLRIAAAIWPFWDTRGLYREGEARLRRLLELAPGSSAARGRALCARAWLVALLGDFESAGGLMAEGVAMVREHGTAAQLAWSLAEHGNIAFSLGDAVTSEACFTESLALSRDLDDTFLTGLDLFGLAYVSFLHGDIDAMQARLEQSLELTGRLIQPWGIAWAQFSLGVVAIMRGDMPGAVAPVTESLEHRWAIRDARGLADSLELLAMLASDHGDADWAALLHGAAELQREANGLTVLPFLRPMHDESVDRLRSALGDAGLDERWRLGRSMPLGKLVAEALARSPQPARFPATTDA